MSLRVFGSDLTNSFRNNKRTQNFEKTLSSSSGNYKSRKFAGVQPREISIEATLAILKEQNVLERTCGFLSLSETDVLFKKAQGALKKRLLQIICQKISQESDPNQIKELWMCQCSLPRLVSEHKDHFIRITSALCPSQRDVRMDLHRTHTNHSYFQDLSKYFTLLFASQLPPKQSRDPPSCPSWSIQPSFLDWLRPRDELHCWGSPLVWFFQGRDILGVPVHDEPKELQEVLLK